RPRGEGLARRVAPHPGRSDRGRRDRRPLRGERWAPPRRALSLKSRRWLTRPAAVALTRAMGSLAWLSIADLHVSASSVGGLWAPGEDEPWRDLDRVHKHAGPFHFILCAGDVAQTGAREDYDALTERLESLLAHLADLGSRPALFVVPGNHDLARPDERAPALPPPLPRSHDPDLPPDLFWP